MRRIDYINHLELKLRDLPRDEVKKILDEVNKKIDEGVNSGLSEEEVMSNLGTPDELSKQYLNKAGISTPVSASDKKGGVGEVLFVIFFNLLIGIPGWLSLLAVVLSLVAFELGLIFGVAAVFSTVLLWGPFVAFGIMLGITTLLAAVTVFALAYFAVKFYIIGLASYIKWNSKLCKEGF